MVIFNKTLLQAIPSIAKSTWSEIAQNVNINRTTLTRNAEKGDIRMCVLVDICNYIKIDIRNFFKEKEGMDNIDKLLAERSTYVNAVFNSEILEKYKDVVVRDSVKASKVCQLINYGNKNLLEKLCNLQDSEKNTKKDEECQQKRSQDKCRFDLRFNHELFEMLPKLTGVSGNKIGEISKTSGMTYHRSVKVQNCKIMQIVEICNHFRIPISHFFVNGDARIIPDNLFMNEDEWEDVVFHPELILSVPSEDGEYTQKDIAAAIGIHKTNLPNMTKEESSMTMKDLANLCNKLMVPYKFFFTTGKEVRPQLVHITRLENKVRKLEAQLEKERAMIRLLESRIRHLETMRDV